MSDWKDLAPGDDYYYIPNVYGGESYQTSEECAEEWGSSWLVCDHEMIDKYYEMRSELESMRARAEAAEERAFEFETKYNRVMEISREYVDETWRNQVATLREKVASLEVENKECMSRFLHEQRAVEHLGDENFQLRRDNEGLLEALREIVEDFPLAEYTAFAIALREIASEAIAKFGGKK